MTQYRIRDPLFENIVFDCADKVIETANRLVLMQLRYPTQLSVTWVVDIEQYYDENNLELVDGDPPGWYHYDTLSGSVKVVSQRSDE